MPRFILAIVYGILRFVDELVPGWSAPKEPPADHLSQGSYTYWISKHYTEGDQP